MKTEIKELIDEFIYYRENRKPIKYLKNANNKLGDRHFIVLLGQLLQWQKETTLGWKDIEKLEIEEVTYNQFKNFFDECPELTLLFKLENNKIIWSESIKEDEKIEIRDYIHENYKIRVSFRLNESR